MGSADLFVMADSIPPGSSVPLVPIVLVTGFLGSGKTTLINAVLRDTAFAGTMVIVNEFGSVGLDHLLVSNADDQVVLLDSGCLCCASSATLRDTLINLFAGRSSGTVPAFDRIIVETSGLAHPAPIVASLLGDSALTPRCTLTQVLTLVDAQHGAETLARYAEARRQVAFADRVVVSKTDTASESQIVELGDLLHQLNALVPIESWRQGQAAVALFAPPLFAAPRCTAESTTWMRGPLRPQYGDAEPEQEAEGHGDAFLQITIHTLWPKAVDWATYAGWIQALSRRFGKRLLRCKGLLALGDGDAPWVIQGVQGYFAPPQLLPRWPASVPHGFLVCIGESISRAELDAVVAPQTTFHSSN
jgi:G3E family GTPase